MKFTLKEEDSKSNARGASKIRLLTSKIVTLLILSCKNFKEKVK